MFLKILSIILLVLVGFILLMVNLWWVLLIILGVIIIIIIMNKVFDGSDYKSKEEREREQEIFELECKKLGIKPDKAVRCLLCNTATKNERFCDTCMKKASWIR